MNCYNLGGHSGCGILLCENEDGTTFVRKVSKDIAYNDRLKVQCEKQRSFESGAIRAPKVLGFGTDEKGLFYFDMEYIRGVTLAEYIKTIEIGKIRGLVEMLVKSIVPAEKSIVTPEQAQNTNRIFREKLAGLRESLTPLQNPTVDQALDMLESHDWSGFAASPCHGDMTLENIIVRNDEAYFIDFLDSFYDCWLMDAGTLLQDVLAMWSYRFQSDVSMNTVLRLMVFRDLLLDAVEKIDPAYTVEICYALLQKLVRIYPYTKDAQTYEFLNEKTAMVVEKLKARCGKCGH